MFEKLLRTKVFRDPIYGYIEVDYKIISDLIDSREVQRLRRIRQLSGVSMVFQTAEHSRFTHSLGAYMMARLACEKIEGMDQVDEYQKVLLQMAALLHDIGHGPYSHAFEDVLGIEHEEMTIKMLLSIDSDVNQILAQYDDNLCYEIANIIGHQGKYPLLESLISSSLDVDRLDFLTRDAYFTGAVYGQVDYRRILRTMKIVDNQLYVRTSGVNAVEAYIMSRYHMYFQVYYHPVAKAYELILEGIYQRIKDLVNKGVYVDASIDSFLDVLKNSNDVSSYINLDDAYVNGFIKQLAKTSDDYVLKKLSNAFQNRHLFNFVELANDPTEEFLNELKEKYNNEYGKYFYKDIAVSNVAYLHVKKYDVNNINVLLPDGRIKSLDQYSLIVKGLTQSSNKVVERIYYFED